MPEDYQTYVDQMLSDGRQIGGQNAGDAALTNLSSVELMRNLSAQEISYVVKMYNLQNDSDNLPDATFTQSQDGDYITFNDPEVPTTQQAYPGSRRMKEIG